MVNFIEMFATVLSLLSPTIRFLIMLSISFFITTRVMRIVLSTLDIPTIGRKTNDNQVAPLTEVEKDRIAWWGR